VQGFDVVEAIGAVPVGANSRPIVPVVMNSVTILRIGSAANAFNAPSIQPPLPEPRGIRSEVRAVGASRLLLWPTIPNHDYRVVASTDLIRWSFAGIFPGGQVGLTPSLPRLFATVYETNVDL